jgi:hypothetical protein
MWFKNLKLFRLSPEWAWTFDQIEDFLNKERFAQADASAASSVGWVAVREQDQRLAYPIGKQIICAFRSEKKLLPASVINQFVKARAQDLEEQQGFKPGRKQRRDLPDIKACNAVLCNPIPLYGVGCSEVCEIGSEKGVRIIGGTPRSPVQTIPACETTPKRKRGRGCW